RRRIAIAVRRIIRVAVGAPVIVVIEARPETAAVTEISLVGKAARCGREVLTGSTASQSAGSTADMGKATDAGSAKPAHVYAACESTDMRAAESAAHMRAATEPSGVAAAEAAAVSAATSAAARKRISSQCSGQSHSRDRDDHGLTYHWAYSFD